MSPTGSANSLPDNADAVDGPSNANDSIVNVTDSWQMDRQQQQQLDVSWAAGSSNAAHGSAEEAQCNDDDAGSSRDGGGWMLSAKFWLPGLVLSTALCSGILGPLLPLGMPLHEPLIAVSKGYRVP
jgi:hypothetical protein